MNLYTNPELHLSSDSIAPVQFFSGCGFIPAYYWNKCCLISTTAPLVLLNVDDGVTVFFADGTKAWKKANGLWKYLYDITPENVSSVVGPEFCPAEDLPLELFQTYKLGL